MYNFSCSIFTRILAVMMLLPALVACGDSGNDGPGTDPETVSAPLTVLVYMVADNSLGTDWGCDDADLNEMLSAAVSSSFNGCRLIVYHNRPGTAKGNPPQLLEVTSKGLKILKNYPDDVSVYSVDPERIKEVMADMKTYASAEEYGLVLWSHADGWLGPTAGYESKYRSFGDDRGYHITVQTLAETLADEHFSFVYFDCCLMGNIETIYELRGLSDIMVASPTKLGIDGMPYDLNVPVMFDLKLSESERAVRMATNTFNSYNDIYDECQIAVYDLSGIDGFASATRDIFVTVDEYARNLYRLQSYNAPSDVKTLYDMDNYMELLTAGGGEALLTAWRSELDKLVIYKATTELAIGNLSVSRYCGLGSFAIGGVADISNRGYNKLQWWEDVVSSAPAYN